MKKPFTNTKSDLEYIARMYAIDSVEKGKVMPHYAIAGYVNALNYIMKGTNKTAMLAIQKAKMGLSKHPMQKQGLV